MHTLGWTEDWGLHSRIDLVDLPITPWPRGHDHRSGLNSRHFASDGVAHPHGRDLFSLALDREDLGVTLTARSALDR